MAIPPQFLYRDVQFHPPEADRVAEKIAELIRKFTSEKSSVDGSMISLNSDWEGHHKEMFVSDVNPHQRKGESNLEYLKRQESFYRNLKVTKREVYTNPAWEAYTGGKR